MDIKDIKSKLTIAEVIKHYGLKADKQNRLKCPFHEDKTPSLQLYYKTQTAFCFSTNCTTHGKAIDVIDFIMYYEKCTKHEAIKKAEQKIISPTAETTKPVQQSNDRAMFLERMFTYFKNAVSNSKPAQEYLQSRCIEFRNTEVGYNAGQFHHGARKDESLINDCLKYGILLDLGLKSRTGDTAYKPFGKWCIVFAMRNKADEIVSLYFRSTLTDKEQRHFYLRDRQGLYPHYPPTSTKKLILTESIIDCVTLLQQPEIASKYNLLALYGTNGFTEEHQTAIRALQSLEEIIFFLNGDEAGNKAVAKYAPMLKAEYPNLKITSVAVPQNEDVNSLLQGHSPEILTHLIDTRKEVNFLFSSEEVAQRTEKTTLSVENKKAEEVQEPEPITGLNTANPYNLKYQGNEAQYQIKGFRIEQLDSLKITLQITIQ
ncbi:MAG: CHC2 zinc finger domain-containing protein [Flavobacterium sp.]|nr:CHC2 zinc finger domain-containing protein [Flavobacterium sp.]